MVWVAAIENGSAAPPWVEASPVVAADNPRFVVFGRNYSSERVGATALIGSFPGLMGVGSDISTAALAQVGAEFTTY